jgi:hypothetical protein
VSLKPYLPLVAFLAAVVAAGVAHGLHTDRWGRSPDREAAAARLANVPTTIGPWVGEDRLLDAEEVHSAGVDGYLLRVYRNSVTRQSVTLFVVSGRPGPVAVHTPDVCYQASGYAMAAEPARESIPLPAAPADVWATTMAKPSAALPEALSVRWAWRTRDAGWRAPDRPRVTFARAGVLYKLYVLTDRLGGRSARPDPAAEFLTLALPALDRALAEDPASPPGG